jgi:hypothetical protein
MHAGVAVPFGHLNRTTNPGTTINIDFVYQFTTRTWADARLGYSIFNGSGGSRNVDIWNLSANLRFIPWLWKVSPFVNGGLGLYHVSSLEAGFNIGAGLGFHFVHWFDIEATFNYHYVFTASPDVTFGKVQLGLIRWF